MGMSNAARDLVVAALVSGTISPAFNNANASIGVGDSATAYANTQTDLQAATNKYRKGMDATYPTVATNVLTFRATFTTGEANYAWNEWGVFNTTSQSGGTILNRKQEALGTKPGTQSWQFVATLTFTAA